MPGNHIEWRMAQFGLPQGAAPLDVEGGRDIAVLVRRDGGQEVSRIRQTVGTDRATLGKGECPAVVLAQVAARSTVGHLDAQFHASRDDDDLAGFRVDDAEFGPEPDISVFQDEQHLCVTVVKQLSTIELVMR